MSNEPEYPDSKRIRNGLIFLVTGVVLVLWAWGSWIYRTWEPEVLSSGSPGDAAESGANPRDGVPTSVSFLVGAVILVLVFLGSCIVVWIRRGAAGASDAQENPPSDN